MKRLILLLFVVALLVPAVRAEAADYSPVRSPRVAASMPFPRSERAQMVWDSNACLSQCGAVCAWGQADCLRQDAPVRESQGACLALTDGCDRVCQRNCRMGAGPLLPLD